MEIHYAKINSYLSKPGFNNLWISSAEEFLLYYTQRQLINKARQQGFTIERIALLSDKTWPDLFGSLVTNQLFVTKRLIVVDCRALKVDAKFAKNWQQVIKHTNQDLVIQLITNKVLAAQKKANWFKSLVNNQDFIAIWPLQNYHQWLQQQLCYYKFIAEPTVITQLAILSKENPRTTINILEKLSASKVNNITINDLELYCSEADDIAVMQILDNILLGNNVITSLADVARSNDNLLLIWALLNSKFLKLIVIMNSQAPELRLKQEIRNLSEQKILLACLHRHTASSIKAILGMLWQLELIIKGVDQGNPVEQLTKIALAIIKV